MGAFGCVGFSFLKIVSDSSREAFYQLWDSILGVLGDFGIPFLRFTLWYETHISEVPGVHGHTFAFVFRVYILEGI